jgi:hypothetical protein
MELADDELMSLTGRLTITVVGPGTTAGLVIWLW